MPGTFSLPPRVSDPDMHHGMPWCMPGSLTSSFLWIGGGGNVQGIPGACATRNFTCLVRGPSFDPDTQWSLLTLEVPSNFLWFHRPFWMTSSGIRKVIRNYDNQRHAEENLSTFVVSIVPADGLAPSGARASASTVMTRSVPHVYIYIYIYIYSDWLIR